MLGAIVVLLRHSGGIYAYGKFVHNYLTDKRSVETSSLVLSTCLFIDDYLSSLTVGSVMRPLTTVYNVARVKLAFMVDAMAAPLAILCPFSSWVAAIIGYLRDAGVTDVIENKPYIIEPPFNVYLNIIPYMFYSFMIVVAAWFIVRRRISFGLMGHYERYADKNPMPVTADNTHKDPHLSDFLIPMFILLISVVGSLLYSGGGSLRDSNAAVGLFMGGSLALTFTTIFLLYLNHTFHFCCTPR